MSKKDDIQMVRISPTVTAPVDIFTARRVRHGKTKQDRDSGATARRIKNRQERQAWADSRNPTLADFPYHTCNGKKNRSLKTVGRTEDGTQIQKYVGATHWMNRKVSTA